MYGDRGKNAAGLKAGIMNRITYKQVERIADLAKLSIDDTQNEQLQKDMGNILAFADQLAKLDIQDVQPTTHAVTIQNVFREDVLKESVPREDLLRQAPAQNGMCYVVPKVVD